MTSVRKSFVGGAAHNYLVNKLTFVSSLPKCINLKVSSLFSTSIKPQEGLIVMEIMQ